MFYFSWGAGWGEEGYMRITRGTNNNMCSISAGEQGGERRDT